MRAARPRILRVDRRVERRRARTGSAVGVSLLALVVLASCASTSNSSDPSDPSDSSGRATNTTAVAEAPWSGPTVIIDTDLSKWWDDATAVGIANALQQQGSLRVLGMGTDVPNPVAVAAVDA